MSEYTNIGRNILSFDMSPAFSPYSKVVVWIDDETCITSGDDSGRTLEVTLPWATQELVDAMLARITGFIYRPFSATGAELDPAVELGDAVIVNGIYAPLATIETEFDRSCNSSISAPADEEIDHEYPYTPPTNREITRKTKQLRTLIEKTAEEIRLSVSEVSDDLSTLEGSVSELSVKLNSITLSVSNGAYSSTIKLLANGIEIASQDISMSGMITVWDLSQSGATTINGDNITTGTIEGRTFRSILDASGNVGGEIEMCYLNNTTVAGGIRLDDQGAGTDDDRQYRMFLYTEEVEGVAFALKLKSASGMSLEAVDNIYIDAGTKVVIYGANITAAANGRFILNGGTVEIGGAVSFNGSVDFSNAAVTGLPKSDTTTEEETT